MSSAPERYSIAKARDQLARLVHEAEAGRPVELTRRGEAVAVILSLHDYRRLRSGGNSFIEALETFRRDVDLEGLSLGPEELADLRDRSTGRTVEL